MALCKYLQTPAPDPQALLDLDINIEGPLLALLEAAAARANTLLAALRAVLLVESLAESAKFAVGMYLLSYLGAAITGLTLLTLAWAALFTLPR